MQIPSLKREHWPAGGSAGGWWKFITGLALGGLAFSGNGRLWADTNEWVHSSGSTSWFQPGNWSAGVPTAGDDVEIGINSTAFVDGTNAAQANNLNIDNGGVAVGNINPGNLSVTGTLAVGTSGTASSLALNYGTISVNTLAVGANGTYSDTTYGTLNLIGSDPTIEMAAGVTVTVHSQVAGTNGLNKAGLGTLVLDGNNSYSGGTTISMGTLQVGDGGTTGNLGAGDVLDDGTLVFDRSDTITVSNSISGTGNVIQQGSGTTILTGDNTYSGGTTITNGTLQVGDGGTSGSLGAGDVADNSALVFDRSDTIVVSNRISGAGTVSQQGGGTLVLAGDNSYSGTTTITTNGTVQVGNGGTTGTLGSGNVQDNGTLAFDRSDTLVVSNQIAGAGGVSQIGSGTTILTGNNSYSGMTEIAGGTLQVGNGGSDGSIGTNAVVDNGSLVFDRSDDMVVNNFISGAGSVVQAGTNVVTLTATNTYSGGTTIENGGTIKVANGWALGQGDVNVLNGTLEAGATSLTNKTIIHVGGNYSQSADGTLDLTIGGAVANDGTNEYDRVQVAGKANLNGTLQLNGSDGYVPEHNDEQELVTADGGVSGTFSEVSNNISHSALLDPQLVYGSTNVWLKWEQMSFVGYLATNHVALTRNELAIARGLDSILNSTATNDVNLINRLDYLNDLTNNLPPTLRQMSPDQLSSMVVAGLGVMDAQGNEFLRRVDELHTDYRTMYSLMWSNLVAPGKQQSFEKFINRSWNIYGEVPVNFANVKGDGNADGYNITTLGMGIGADNRLTENLYLGGSVGYANSSAGLDDDGSMNMNSFYGNVYGTWVERNWHFEGMVGGEVNSYDTKRSTIGGTASGTSSGEGFTGLLGGGYDWESGPWKLGPELSFQYMDAQVGGFTESGSLEPLQIQSQSQDALHSQLGVNVRYRYLASQWTFINPDLFLGWRHDFIEEDLPVSARFVNSQGSNFTVYSPKLGNDSIVASLGVSVQWLPSINTFLNGGLEVGRSGYSAESISIGARYSF